MKFYMLDTNTVSYLIRKNPAVHQRLSEIKNETLCVSAITKGELLFGLVKRPAAKDLARMVKEFLKHIDILPWDDSITSDYATVRGGLEKQGKMLSPLDMLIAAHALSVGAMLVTNDRAFKRVPCLATEDWTLTQ